LIPNREKEKKEGRKGSSALPQISPNSLVGGKKEKKNGKKGKR